MNSSKSRHIKALRVSIFGGSYGNSEPRGNVDIRPPPTEYHHPVYCNSYDTGYISGDRTSDGTIGETTVVEERGYIPRSGGSESGGKGGRGFYGVWCGDRGRGA